MPMPLFDRLVIATHNAGKQREFAALLAPYAGKIISAAELGLPEPEETGQTFTENALIKARAAAQTGHAALADDSGLCVAALKDAPGIYSARWAGPDKNFQSAMQRIQDELGSTENRVAYFICVLALVRPDGGHELFEGRIDGKIIWPPRGDGGHGYDPVFVPQGQMRTFAEMPDDEKNAISHRGVAVRNLIELLKRG